MEYFEEEQYLKLVFQEKIEQKYFMKSNLFFKIVNLDSNKPFIQVGNHVFNGKYEDACGTDLFFEEQKQLRQSSIYEKQTPIHLEYKGKASKVLNLKWQKIPGDILDVDEKELIQLKFTESYDTVLSKIENGTLNINNIIENKMAKPEETHKKIEKKHEEYEKPASSEDELIEQVEEKKQSKLIINRYDMLKKLITKTQTIPEYLDKASIDGNFKTNSEFLILKDLYLKNLDFKSISAHMDEKNIENLVDIQASINDKIIQPKDVKKLTDHDKQLLFSLQNFDNLSIPMKLTLIIEHLKEEKKHLLKLSEDELEIEDEFGRTAKDRYKLLKSLAKDLQYYLFLRMREHKLIGRDFTEV